MTLQLDKIDPKFRKLTDLFLFTDRMDLDLSEYKILFKENCSYNLSYFQDRFEKSSNILWNNEKYWYHRLYFLLSLEDQLISKYIEDFLEKRILLLLRNKSEIDIRYDIEYLQFVEYCKVKYYRGDNITIIKNKLTSMPSFLKEDKLIKLINSFIPFIFKDLNEYADIISHKITHSYRNFELLLNLEKVGLKFDKKPIIQLAYDIIENRSHNSKNRRALFTVINDYEILSQVKLQYQINHRNRLLELIKECDYHEIEEFHLRNIKNLLILDPFIGDDLALIYIEKLYSRNTGHKRANINKIIRLLNTFPQIIPKKILGYLSYHNKMSDIKYMLSSFPELKKIAVFI